MIRGKILFFSYDAERYADEIKELSALGNVAKFRQLVEDAEVGCACNKKLEPCHYVITDEKCIEEAYRKRFPDMEIRLDDQEPEEIQDDIEAVALETLASLTKAKKKK